MPLNGIANFGISGKEMDQNSKASYWTACTKQYNNIILRDPHCIISIWKQNVPCFSYA